MKIFITGGTGFIGRALSARLVDEGHDVIVWSRRPARVRELLGNAVEAAGPGDDPEALARCVAASDAVVNLAGEPVAPGRWTPKRKRAIRESRVSLTTDLVEAMRVADTRPAVLVSASAVGYYGDRGGERLTERSSAGSGFLAEVCSEWEDAAAAASGLGVRVVIARIGIVLGRDGGALSKMLPAFRAWLGGPIGSGDQFWPWIHLDDAVAVLLAAITDDALSGPVNVTAPSPVTSADFARGLGAALKKPARIRVPRWALGAALGEASEALTASQRAEPAALRAHGFAYRFAELDAALADLVR